jgi:hypothetical protein
VASAKRIALAHSSENIFLSSLSKGKCSQTNAVFDRTTQNVRKGVVMLETDKTVLDVSRGQKRPPNGRGIKWAAGLAFVILCIALGIAVVRNVDLQEETTQAQDVAAKRALEIKRLTEQRAIVPKTPSTESADPDMVGDQFQGEEPDQTGIDGSVPPKPTEKW